MDSFFSKASSFVSSQLDHQAPPPSRHGDSVAHSPSNTDEEPPRNPASSGGYGDLLAGAQSLIGSAKPSGRAASADDEEGEPHKAPSSGGYGDLVAGAQALMGGPKPSGGVGETHKSPSSGGYGDLFASAQSFMGTAKSSGGGGAPSDKQDEGEVPHKTTSSGGSGYADVFASAQVLMGAAKIGSRDGVSETDMGEVAGAASNLIDAASHYGNIEKTPYGDYAQKAKSYLHDYQVSHGKTAPQGNKKPSPSQEEDVEETPSNST